MSNATDVSVITISNTYFGSQFQWLFLDQISFKTNQKTKYKVDVNFNFISIEKNFFSKYPNFLAHLLL